MGYLDREGNIEVSTRPTQAQPWNTTSRSLNPALGFSQERYEAHDVDEQDSEEVLAEHGHRGEGVERRYVSGDDHNVPTASPCVLPWRTARPRGGRPLLCTSF